MIRPACVLSRPALRDKLRAVLHFCRAGRRHGGAQPKSHTCADLLQAAAGANLD